MLRDFSSVGNFRPTAIENCVGWEVGVSGLLVLFPEEAVQWYKRRHKN